MSFRYLEARGDVELVMFALSFAAFYCSELCCFLHALARRAAAPSPQASKFWWRREILENVNF
jgi:hypothetical protein